MRYLQGIITHGLTIHASNTLQLNAYSDVDWAGCPDDRRSTTGFCIFLGPNLISWSATKQPTVSRSSTKASTKAEYRNLALTCTELFWLQYLLCELRVPSPNPLTLWCDNIGATFLAANPMFHARTKHVEIDYHFVREKITSKDLSVCFVCSNDQLVDFFTKSPPSPRFNSLRTKLIVASALLACGGYYNTDTAFASHRRSRFTR